MRFSSKKCFRCLTLGLVGVLVTMLMSPAAFAGGGYHGGGYHGGGYHGGGHDSWGPPSYYHGHGGYGHGGYGHGGYGHGGHGDDWVPALFAGILVAGATCAIVSSVASPPAPRCVSAYAAPAPCSAGAVMVTAPLLNARSGPSMGSPTVYQIPSGAVLSVEGSTPGWYYVRTPNNLYGWVMVQYTAPAYPSAG